MRGLELAARHADGALDRGSVDLASWQWRPARHPLQDSKAKRGRAAGGTPGPHAPFLFGFCRCVRFQIQAAPNAKAQTSAPMGPKRDPATAAAMRPAAAS